MSNSVSADAPKVLIGKDLKRALLDEKLRSCYSEK